MQLKQNQEIVNSKMKHQGFQIINFSLKTSLTALLVITGSIPVISPQVNAQKTPVLTAQIPAGASVIYVNPVQGDNNNGSNSEATPYKTITFALTTAQPGTVIKLAPGTYSKDTGEKFPLVVNSGITLFGDESNKGQGILIIGGGYFTSPTFARQDITILAKENTAFSGITFTNPNSRGTAIWVESTNAVITNSTFSNSLREGVFVTGTGNPRIENNIFFKNQGNGLSITKSSQGIIRSNLFQNTGFGLAIGGSSTPLIEANNITENTDGLFISESAKPVLRRNAIQKNKRDGVVATITAMPDLGTEDSPGGNLIKNNARYDLNNATKNRMIAIGNDINQKQIFGAVDFVAATVTTPPDNNTGNNNPPDNNTGTIVFKDVQTGYWAKSYIEALATQNILAGFADGTFKPNEPVTRAQFAAIINKAFNPQAVRAAIKFKDVKTSYWAYSAIQSASSSPFLSGYADLTFKPEQKIPRVQALVALANGLGLTANSNTIISVYSDAGQIPSYALAPVAAATSKQLVINYPIVNQLAPNRPATRAEIAAFVYQALVNAGRAQAIPSAYIVPGQ